MQLADKLEISLRTYQRIEYGNQKPNVNVVIRLQKLFRKSIDEIIYGDLEPKRNEKQRII